MSWLPQHGAGTTRLSSANGMCASRPCQWKSFSQFLSICSWRHGRKNVKKMQIPRRRRAFVPEGSDRVSSVTCTGCGRREIRTSPTSPLRCWVSVLQLCLCLGPSKIGFWDRESCGNISRGVGHGMGQEWKPTNDTLSASLCWGQLGAQSHRATVGDNAEDASELSQWRGEETGILTRSVCICHWWNAAAKSASPSTFRAYPAQTPSVRGMCSARVKAVFRGQPGGQRQVLCGRRGGHQQCLLKTFSPHWHRCQHSKLDDNLKIWISDFSQKIRRQSSLLGLTFCMALHGRSRLMTDTLDKVVSLIFRSLHHTLLSLTTNLFPFLHDFHGPCSRHLNL